MDNFASSGNSKDGSTAGDATASISHTHVDHVLFPPVLRCLHKRRSGQTTFRFFNFCSPFPVSDIHRTWNGTTLRFLPGQRRSVARAPAILGSSLESKAKSPHLGRVWGGFSEVSMANAAGEMDALHNCQQGSGDWLLSPAFPSPVLNFLARIPMPAFLQFIIL